MCMHSKVMNINDVMLLNYSSEKIQRMVLSQPNAV